MARREPWRGPLRKPYRPRIDRESSGRIELPQAELPVAVGAAVLDNALLREELDGGPRSDSGAFALLSVRHSPVAMSEFSSRVISVSLPRGR